MSPVSQTGMHALPVVADPTTPAPSDRRFRNIDAEPITSGENPLSDHTSDFPPRAMSSDGLSLCLTPSCQSVVMDLAASSPSPGTNPSHYLPCRLGPERIVQRPSAARRKESQSTSSYYTRPGTWGYNPLSLLADAAELVSVASDAHFIRRLTLYDVYAALVLVRLHKADALHGQYNTKPSSDEDSEAIVREEPANNLHAQSPEQ